ALLELRDLRRHRDLGEPAREEEVPRVAACDVHDLAAQSDVVHVLGEDHLHPSPRDVRKQRHLSRALHRDRNLPLVAATRARDPPRADLALLRDVAPQLVVVLVVDLLDLLLAEVTALPPDRPGRGAGSLPACLLSRLCHGRPPRTGCRRRSRTGRSRPARRRLSPPSPLAWSFCRVFTASLSLQTAVPLGVWRSSGSRVRLPTRTTRLMFAIGTLLPYTNARS